MKNRHRKNKTRTRKSKILGGDNRIDAPDETTKTESPNVDPSLLKIICMPKDWSIEEDNDRLSEKGGISARRTRIKIFYLTQISLINHDKTTVQLNKDKYTFRFEQNRVFTNKIVAEPKVGTPDNTQHIIIDNISEFSGIDVINNKDTFTTSQKNKCHIFRIPTDKELKYYENLDGLKRVHSNIYFSGTWGVKGATK